MDTVTRWQHMSGRKTSNCSAARAETSQKDGVSERRHWEGMCFETWLGPLLLGRTQGHHKAAATAPAEGGGDAPGARVGSRGSGPGCQGRLPHPLGLLQLLRQLLQGRRVSLPHVLDLSFMVLSFFLKGLL